MESLPVTDASAPARAAHVAHLAHRAQAARGRNRLFGVLLATISLTMFAIVVGLVIAFHAFEAYRVIPGF